MRERARMHTGERVPEKALWLLLLYVFSSTWACPMQIGVSQECCLFCPEVFILVLGPSFDLPCLLAIAILDSFSLFYLPNTEKLFHVHVRILSFKGSNRFNIFFSPGLPLVKKIISFINKVSNRTTNFKQQPKKMPFSL